MDSKELAAKIDHTLLYKDHTLEDLDRLVEEANEYGMNVCVPPSRVGYVTDELEVEGEIATVIGFALGYNTTDVKVTETERALDDGATEIDMACNVSELKSGNYDSFMDDVEGVVEASGGAPVKAIIETGILTEDEKRRASNLCVEAGADYIKTCTGFFEGKATLNDVRLIKDEVGDRAKIKASGGIGDYESASEMIDAGASRIGASSGYEIMNDFVNNY
ncbi:MAG: deoxyribose-phosphate aldolase [Halobacteria archaeon]|nr:deoxyribose-phosphate aldolase [Halobacteria archaeon]